MYASVFYVGNFIISYYLYCGVEEDFIAYFVKYIFSHNTHLIRTSDMINGHITSYKMLYGLVVSTGK